MEPSKFKTIIKLSRNSIYLHAIPICNWLTKQDTSESQEQERDTKRKAKSGQIRMLRRDIERQREKKSTLKYQIRKEWQKEIRKEPTWKNNNDKKNISGTTFRLREALLFLGLLQCTLLLVKCSLVCLTSLQDLLVHSVTLYLHLLLLCAKGYLPIDIKYSCK